MTDHAPDFDSADQPQHDARERAAQNKALDEAIELLRGLFDCVIILATATTEDGQTTDCCRMDGNRHAQNGLMDHALRQRRTASEFEVRQWIEQDEGEQSA